MGYLTDMEASQALNMPVSDLHKTEVHKCPHGYHVDAIKEYCSQHGIPIGTWKNIVGLSSPDSPDDDRVNWCTSIHELLWMSNKFTVAMLVSSDAPHLWEFVKTLGGTRLIVIGDSTQCHVSFKSWDKAIEVACQKI